MKEAVEAGDWLKVSKQAHIVKGASGYVGFGRLHYTCASPRLAYLSDQLHQLPNWYQMFIEKTIEAKRYIPRFLHSLKKGEDVQQYIEDVARRDVAVADGYLLLYCEEDDFVYCLAQNQTLLERKAKIDRTILHPGLSQIDDKSKQIQERPEVAELPEFQQQNANALS